MVAFGSGGCGPQNLLSEGQPGSTDEVQDHYFWTSTVHSQASPASFSTSFVQRWKNTSYSWSPLLHGLRVKCWCLSITGVSQCVFRVWLILVSALSQPPYCLILEVLQHWSKPACFFLKPLAVAAPEDPWKKDWLPLKDISLLLLLFLWEEWSHRALFFSPGAFLEKWKISSKRGMS